MGELSAAKDPGALTLQIFKDGSKKHKMNPAATPAPDRLSGSDVTLEVLLNAVGHSAAEF